MASKKSRPFKLSSERPPNPQESTSLKMPEKLATVYRWPRLLGPLQSTPSQLFSCFASSLSKGHTAAGLYGLPSSSLGPNTSLFQKHYS